MKRNQVFVRCQLPNNRWTSVDVLDLTQRSFNIFILERLMAIGAVTSIKEDYVEGDHIAYKIKPDRVQQYLVKE